MKTYTVFYAGLLYGEYGIDEWPGATSLPDGCWLRFTCNDSTYCWYVHRSGAFEPTHIPEEEVPNELRAMVLLMQ